MPDKRAVRNADVERAPATLLGHAFDDSSLAEQALTHRSRAALNNERLEFLGDSLVNMLVAELLYEYHPRADEGAMSRMRAELVSGQALAQRARDEGLGTYLLLGQGERKSGGFRRDSILADAFEAVVAAIFLDAGYSVCRERVRAVFSDTVVGMGKTPKDAKTRLQEWLQSRGLPLPEYKLEGSHGADHAKVFEVSCEVAIDDGQHFLASGNSRRAAEQAAAEAAIEVLERGSP